MTGMLQHVDEMFQKALGLSAALETKTAARELSSRPRELDAGRLVAAAYDRIERNWDGSVCRSRQLWRWVAKTDISEHNTSPEKTLEKAIVEHAREWVNQIPAASGLLAGQEQRHMNVDLGRRMSSGCFELVELKAGPNADTPLRAAVEITAYGLLYCFARANESALNVPHRDLFDARRIDLKVLAPQSVYSNYRLGWLAQTLDQGLQQFSKKKFSGALDMRFQFEVFPPEFVWPGAPVSSIPDMLTPRSGYTG